MDLDPTIQHLTHVEHHERTDIWTLIESMRPRWMDQGACFDHPEVNFFPTPGQSLRPAKAICAECPVQAECLAYAVGAKTLRGVWGGLGERERQRIYQHRFQ